MKFREITTYFLTFVHIIIIIFPVFIHYLTFIFNNMATIQSNYEGDLRTKATHLQSKTVLFTDAPTDNNGKGEAFSPTDLVAAALGSCMMTFMALFASKNNIALENATEKISYQTTKVMSSDLPRRIVEIKIDFKFPQSLQLDPKDQQRLINVAHTCAVALSLNPNIKQTISFSFD